MDRTDDGRVENLKPEETTRRTTGVLGHSPGGPHVGHTGHFPRIHTKTPHLGIIKGNPGVIQADPDPNPYKTRTRTQGRGFGGWGQGFSGQRGQPRVSGFTH